MPNEQREEPDEAHRVGMGGDAVAGEQMRATLPAGEPEATDRATAYDATRRAVERTTEAIIDL